MIRPFLSINSNENLTIMDLNTKSVVAEFDINSDFDGSIRKFATFVHANNISRFACSSTLNFPDEYGIDSEMLDGFLDSAWDYEIH